MKNSEIFALDSYFDDVASLLDSYEGSRDETKTTLWEGRYCIVREISSGGQAVWH